MKQYTLFLCLCLSASVLVFAQRPERVSPVNPNPGGSPFAPGKEPSVTHTATAFWTTLDGVTTEVLINTEGERPIKSVCWKFTDGKKEYLASGIGHECKYHIVITSTKSAVPKNVGNVITDGYGGIEVQIHGFKSEDFSNTPLVTVSYSKDGKIVGETKIISHPLPEKFKKTE